METDKARWDRIKALFQAALDLAPGERAQFLDDSCRDEPNIREEVESLLAAHADAGRFAIGTVLGDLSSTAAREIYTPSSGQTPTLRTGDRLGPYEIVTGLGSGGMGEVYEARDTRLGRTVAIKVLAPTVAHLHRFRERFHREARAIAAISHAHICAIHDVGDAVSLERAGASVALLDYLVMERIEGETLAHRLAGSTDACGSALPVEDAVGYAIQIAEALDTAHRAGVVHSDLKPSNVMLTKTGIKLLDFGLAKFLPARDSSQPPGYPTSSDTGDGVMRGTLPYMPPEQVEGKRTDARSDIFAFGAVLYEMLSGRQPFVAESQAGLIAAILKHDPPPLDCPPVPPRLEQIVRKCLAKAPDERWQSAKELSSVLELVVQDIDPLASSTSPRGSNAGRTLSGPSEAETTRRAFLNGNHVRHPTASGTSIDTEAARQKTPTTTTASRRHMLTRPAVLIGVVLLAAIVVTWTGISLRRRSGISDPSTHRQLTFVGNVVAATVSPDTRSIAYVAGYGDQQTVYMQDVSGGQSLQVFQGRVVGPPRWSPDGSRMVLSGRSSEGQVGTFVLPRLGGPVRQLLPGTTFPGLAWSPDGTRVAGVNNRPYVSMIEVRTGRASRISLTGGFTWFEDIDWSPEGNWLVILASDGSSRAVLRTVSIDGGAQQTLLRGEDGGIESPRWSAGGDAIYFWSEDQQTSLKKLPVSPRNGTATGSPIPLLPGVPISRRYSISPDGTTLVYTRGGAHTNLWVAVVDGEKRITATQLTSGTGDDLLPSVSPDGQRVVFLRHLHSRGQHGDVFTIGIDGSGLRQLTFDASDADAVWSPDGTEIAFMSWRGGTQHIWKLNVRDGSLQPFPETEVGRSGLEWAPGPRILYQKPNYRNFGELDPVTGEEHAFVTDDSVGWLFYPRYAPDGEQVAVAWNRRDPGLWTISTVNKKETLVSASRTSPGEVIGWSPDGTWIYTVKGQSPPPLLQRIPQRGGTPETVAMLPWARVGHCDTSDGRQIVCAVVDEESSDVWLSENFDPGIK